MSSTTSWREDLTFKSPQTGISYGAQTRYGWKQKPIDRSRVLPYRHWRVICDREVGDGTPSYVNCEFWKWLGSEGNMSRNAVYMRAYDKLFRKVDDKSQLLLSLAERAEIAGMLTDRLGRLANGALKLRRGDFRGFLRSFAIEPKYKHRSKVRAYSHEFSNLWLEYWLGWAPLAGEIDTGLRRLAFGPPPPMMRLRAGAKDKIKFGTRRDTNRLHTAKEGVVDYSVHLGANFEVTDAMAFKDSRWGTSRWAATAWELIPFSFVVNWFIDVGGYIARCDDLVGLTVHNSFHSSLSKVKYIEEVWYYWPYPPLIQEGTLTIDSVKGMDFQRTSGLPLPYVRAQIPELNLSRALTSASLLVKLFTEAT